MVGVGVALSLFVTAAFLTGRSAAGAALTSTARTLAEQISVVCSPPGREAGVCEYTETTGLFAAGSFPDGSCEGIAQRGGPGWFCDWPDSRALSLAPEHVTETLATAAGPHINISRVLISADPEGREVTVRVSGCASDRWLPLVRWCRTATRSRHL